MTKYQIKDFKRWLEVAPTHIKLLSSWNHWLYEPEGFFKQVVEGVIVPASDGSDMGHIKAIQQWMKEVDEGCFESLLLNEMKDLEESLTNKSEAIKYLEQELQTERETTQQALQTSQEWHERQKAEIIAEWSTKYQTLVNKWKTSIRQELTLLRNLLSHD